MAGLFPRREHVPKTLIFAKTDLHADEIVTAVREIFGGGNEFCTKITYRSDDPEQALKDFRTKASMRVAVTVDMIATGTDVRPLECVFFLPGVSSATYFEQMNGRGARHRPRRVPDRHPGRGSQDEVPAGRRRGGGRLAAGGSQAAAAGQPAAGQQRRALSKARRGSRRFRESSRQPAEAAGSGGQPQHHHRRGGGAVRAAGCAERADHQGRTR
jgi:hypothetical protein